MRLLISMTLSGVAAWPALAADVKLSIEIPRLTVAEYHRPYVAVWLERADQSFVGNIAVWYDLKLKDNEGTKWLKDMRQWWRRSGRELSMPVDGLSSATRAARRTSDPRRRRTRCRSRGWPPVITRSSSKRRAKSVGANSCAFLSNGHRRRIRF